MQYNELRKDYLLDRWVVIATERQRRPTDLIKPQASASNLLVCPLCAGNENMTPPASMLYLEHNNKIIKSQDPATGNWRPNNWRVRCIPNLYPAFTAPKGPRDEEKIFLSDSFGLAVGHHEVIVESPNHHEGPTNAQLAQIELVVKAYIDRLRELSSKPYVKYVSIFRNQGIEAGASLSHAHSQVIAMPMVPSTIQEELSASKDYFDAHSKCIYCDIIQRESKSPRLIYENAMFIVLAPFASVNPSEFWILPKKHARSPLKLSITEITAFAQTLKVSLQALKDLVNDPPYNYGFHLSLNTKDDESYHWHLEVYPKLNIWAGFEKSTGIYINTVPPELAAESLKKQIKSLPGC
jgi:UDPglucose--hexose-1-phosphate uridylyltransferase